MQLTGEVFGQILGELTGTDPSSGPLADGVGTAASAGDATDRRAAPRVSWCAGATVYRFAGERVGPALPVGIQNLSPSGICILQYFLWTVGDQFIVELPLRDGQLLRVLCTVKNWRIVNEDLYAMGAEFAGVWAGAFEPESAALSTAKQAAA